MGSFFSKDNAYNGFMSKAFDLCVLNLLFFITCLPIFTIGASLTAMYTMMLRTMEDKQSSIVKSYLSEFAKVFKRSTKLFMLPIAAVVLILFDLWFWSINGKGAGVAFSVVLLIIWGGWMFWLFPMTAVFENTAKNMMINAAKFAISFFPATMFGTVAGLAYCAVLVQYKLLLPLVPFVALVLMLYPHCLYTNRCFKKYIREHYDN